MMIEEFRKKIDILSAFPLYEGNDGADYPAGVIFTCDGRKYVCFSDDKDLEAAARRSLDIPHIKLEDLSDVLQCIIYVMLVTGTDFYGIQQNRDAFEQESSLSWPKCVWDILHDVVKFRLDKCFHYGDGMDNLCVYIDMATRISMPVSEAD